MIEKETRSVKCSRCGRKNVPYKMVETLVGSVREYKCSCGFSWNS